jgi:hypothetical protein
MPPDERATGSRTPPDQASVGRPSRPEREVRAVVLYQPGTEHPALRVSLDRRSIAAVWKSDPFAALAAACGSIPGQERDRAAGAPAAGLIVILAEPERIETAADFVRAVRRYVPRAVCWMYRAKPAPELVPITPEAVMAWERSAGGDRASPHDFAAAQASNDASAGGSAPRPAQAGGWTAPHNGVAGSRMAAGGSARPVLRLTGEAAPERVTPPVNERARGEGVESKPSVQAPAAAAGQLAGAPAEIRLDSSLLTDEELSVLLGEIEPGEARGADAGGGR